MLDVVEVAEDECRLWVEATRDDVLRILVGQLVALTKTEKKRRCISHAKDGPALAKKKKTVYKNLKPNHNVHKNSKQGVLLNGASQIVRTNGSDNNVVSLYYLKIFVETTQKLHSIKTLP